jgi:ACGX-repeat protein
LIFVKNTSIIIYTEGKNRSLNNYTEVILMALSNLFGWKKKTEAASEEKPAACGACCDKHAEAPAACGAAAPEEKPAACGACCDKPAEAPAACGAAAPEEKPAACGASDKPAETSSACGAGDK